VKINTNRWYLAYFGAIILATGLFFIGLVLFLNHYYIRWPVSFLFLETPHIMLALCAISGIYKSVKIIDNNTRKNLFGDIFVGLSITLLIPATVSVLYIYISRMIFHREDRVDVGEFVPLFFAFPVIMVLVIIRKMARSSPHS
jgi:hypothetical protein